MNNIRETKNIQNKNIQHKGEGKKLEILKEHGEGFLWCRERVQSFIILIKSPHK